MVVVNIARPHLYRFGVLAGLCLVQVVLAEPNKQLGFVSQMSEVRKDLVRNVR